MSVQCQTIKGDGTRCRGVAIHGSAYCAAHDPSTQERRQRGAARGGRASKANPARAEIEQVRRLLRIAADQLLRPEHPTIATAEIAADAELRQRFRMVTRADCAVLATILNVKLRTLEVERRMAEQDEILARIENLERLADDHRRGRRFG